MTACCWFPPTSRREGSPPATSTGRASATSRCRSGRPSSPTTRPSATPPRTCGSSWPRRAAAPIRGRRRAQHRPGRHPPRRPHRVAEILGRRDRAGRSLLSTPPTTPTWRSSSSACCRPRPRDGRSCYRTGPSFVRALAGLEPKAATDRRRASGRRVTRRAWAGRGRLPRGADQPPGRRSRRSRGGLTEVELDVATPAGPGPAGRPCRGGHRPGRRRPRRRRGAALQQPHAGPRRRTRPAAWRSPGPSPTAVVEVVRGARTARPAWVVAKGGITSHDVAVHGPGNPPGRGARPAPARPGVGVPADQAPTEVVGVPYVVFAGNVGDDNTLAYVIDLLRGRA